LAGLPPRFLSSLVIGGWVEMWRPLELYVHACLIEIAMKTSYVLYESRV